MENEKLENQKIDENGLESVAGGAELVKYPYINHKFIKLTQREEDILAKADLLHYRENGTGYVKKVDYEKAKDLLEKAGIEFTEKEYKTFLDIFKIDIK